MGGRERDGTAPRECLEDRGGERAPLSGVGTAPDLVEQHQRARPGVRQDVSQRGHVRREGREAGGDRLAVTDVGEHRHEQRQRRVGTDRRDDPALRHETQQADGLDQHGLATGVRAGDEHGELVGCQFEIERHDGDLTP